MASLAHALRQSGFEEAARLRCLVSSAIDGRRIVLSQALEGLVALGYSEAAIFATTVRVAISEAEEAGGEHLAPFVLRDWGFAEYARVLECSPDFAAQLEAQGQKEVGW